MSVQSQINRINGEVSDQTALIQQIKAALGGKANNGSGGGTVITPVIEPLEVHENGTYSAPNGVDGYSPVVVNVSGSAIGTASKKLTSNGRSISFTGLTAQPKAFAIVPTGNITLSSTRYVTGVMYDGSKTHGTYGYRASSSATSYYSASYFTWTYSNGTLTVNTNSSTNGGNFSSSVTYQLVYVG
jgi:hypothetical protein